VENEMFWPGWSMQAGTVRVQAHSVQGFRAWELPAGHYRAVARFTPPYRLLAWLVTAAGAAGWMLLSLLIWKRRAAHEPSTPV
jgi:hypothetical protein